MFCPKCGSKLPDDSKFCSVCGEKLPDREPETQPQKDTPEETSQESRENDPGPELVQPKKRPGGKMIIGIAAAAVLVIAAAAGVKTLVRPAGSDNAYVYLSDGRYELLTNRKKNEAIEIASSRSDSVNADLLAFSPDGKYIYYYTKYDPENNTGSLCRAEYGRLKKDPSKNEAYIQVIDSSVCLGFQLAENGSLVYQKSNGNLYYFNGEEPVQVAKDVSSYRIEESGQRLIYTITKEDQDYDVDLYGLELSDMDNKIKLASNISFIWDDEDFDNILYYVRNDDFSHTFYITGFEKEIQRLDVGENVEFLTSSDGKLYFTAENGTELNLYDYIEDLYADEDAGLAEPKKEDFEIPEYSYEMIHGTDISEDDFDQLYTSCTRPLYWYGMSTWNSYSMEEAVERDDWEGDMEGIHASTQSFIDQFADTADENGFIPVTDEVRAALKEIDKHANDPNTDYQWMWLCYNRYQSGTEVDYDAYNAALDRWNEAKGRIEMREMLQDEENAYKVRSLYCLEDGAVTEISENVLDAEVCYDGILFNTVDMVDKTVNLTDVSSVEEVKQQLFEIDRWEANHIFLMDSEEQCQMSASAAETYGEAYDENYVNLWISRGKAYLWGGAEGLLEADIEGGTVGSFQLVTDSENIPLICRDSVLYYGNDYYVDGDQIYMDLYSRSGGTDTCLARGVIYNEINRYDDGMILAYTDYRENYGYELTMFDSKGDAALIAEDVTQYIRADESALLYISDGDLYCYDGKEKKMLQPDVDILWSREQMDFSSIGIQLY